MRFYAQIFFDLKDLTEIKEIRHKIIQLLPYEVDVGEMLHPPQLPLPKSVLILTYESIYHDSVKTILKRLCPDFSVKFHPYIDNQLFNDDEFSEWLGSKVCLENLVH
jgi:aromatic ring-cleaving dioxygenase